MQTLLECAYVQDKERGAGMPIDYWVASLVLEAYAEGCLTTSVGPELRNARGCCYRREGADMRCGRNDVLSACLRFTMAFVNVVNSVPGNKATQKEGGA